jgi:hypothetical protein
VNPKDLRKDVGMLQRDINAPRPVSQTRIDVDNGIRQIGRDPNSLRHPGEPITRPRAPAPAPATSGPSRAPATTPSRPRGR